MVLQMLRSCVVKNIYKNSCFSQILKFFGQTRVFRQLCVKNLYIVEWRSLQLFQHFHFLFTYRYAKLSEMWKKGNLKFRRKKSKRKIYRGGGGGGWGRRKIRLNYKITRRPGNVRSHIRCDGAHPQLCHSCPPNEEQIENPKNSSIFQKNAVWTKR